MMQDQPFEQRFSGWGRKQENLQGQQPTQPSATNEIILPTTAYEALLRYAHDQRLRQNPAQILHALTDPGVYAAAFVTDRPPKIRRVLVNPTLFGRLQTIQSQMNKTRNFSIMDIVVANLVILLGQQSTGMIGNMYAITQNANAVAEATREDYILFFADTESTWKQPSKLALQYRNFD